MIWHADDDSVQYILTVLFRILMLFHWALFLPIPWTPGVFLHLFNFTNIIKGQLRRSFWSDNYSNNNLSTLQIPKLLQPSPIESLPTEMILPRCIPTFTISSSSTSLHHPYSTHSPPPPLIPLSPPRASLSRCCTAPRRWFLQHCSRERTDCSRWFSRRQGSLSLIGIQVHSSKHQWKWHASLAGHGSAPRRDSRRKFPGRSRAWLYRRDVTKPPAANWQSITPGYFVALGMTSWKMFSSRLLFTTWRLVYSGTTSN